MNGDEIDRNSRWPALTLDAWQETYDTLHMWMQVAGKVKAKLSPFLNEWWHVAYHLRARGLTTGTIPYGTGVFEVNFDFVDHDLQIVTSSGPGKVPPLQQPVADFYREFMAALGSLGIEVSINTMPDEFEPRIPFEEDHQHTSYN